MTGDHNYYANKVVLVTGGAGSIGSAVVRRLLHFNPASVRVLDTNENGIFNLVQDLESRKLRPLVGDVRDEKRVLMAMQGVDVVVHAAALKHVPLSEYNPLEAVNVNILGTQNVIYGAIQANVRNVVNISTDKAVNPVNVMGATKLVAERLVTNAPSYMGSNTNTIFCSVRLGNVLSSNGSVLPLFRKQIQKGGPVTLTSKHMTRFFLTMEAAVEFILTVGAKMEGRETFVPKMPAVKIIDLANALIEELAPIYGMNPESIDITTTGPRPGEKTHETLLSSEEASAAREHESMFVMKYPLWPVKGGVEVNRRDYDSSSSVLLTNEQIKALLSSTEEWKKW